MPSNSDCVVNTYVLNLSTYGERLRYLMDARGVTSKELASHIGSTQRSINKLLNDETSRPQKNLEIAMYLNVSPEYLLHGKVEDEEEIDVDLLLLFEALKKIKLSPKQIKAIRLLAEAMAEK